MPPLRALIAVVARVLVALGPALAAGAGQPGERATPEKLEALVLGLESRTLTASQRVELLKAVDRARGELIAALPDDDRAPSWALDRAGAALDELADDAADWSVLLGIPTEGQRKRTLEAAERAMGLIDWAEAAATRTVTRLQGSILAARGDAAAARAAAEAAEARLSVLIDLEQQVRIPFYRGRAAALIVAADATQRTGPRTRQALESLAPLRLSGPGETIRRATLASLLVAISGEPGPRRDASELAKSGVDAPAPPTPDAGDALARACSRLALLRAAASPEAALAARQELELATRRPPFIVVAHGVAPVTRADPALAMLAAEVVAMSAIEQARAVAVDRRTTWLSDGLAPLAAMLDRTDLALPEGVDVKAFRPLVLAKVASAWATATSSGAATGVSLADLPPAVAFAHGLRLAGTEATRSQGATVLDELSQRPDAGVLGAEALWELAVARWSGASADDGAAAVTALCRLVDRYPESSRAGEAAIKSVELARYSLTRAEEQSATAAARAASVERLTGLYAQSLANAYRLNPAHADAPQWRVEHARMLLSLAGAGGGAGIDTALLDRVLGALEGVPSGTTQRRAADDLAQQIIDTAIAAARRRAPVSAPDPALLSGLARRAVQWSLVRRPQLADGYRLVLGEALADAGDPRALEIASDLAGRQAFGGGQAEPQRARMRLLVGRAQRLAGQTSDAFATLRELVEELDAAAGAVGGAGGSRPGVYWLAWAEMLEILATDKARPDAASSVREQIRRLELVDPTLGGDAAEPARARIRALAR